MYHFHPFIADTGASVSAPVHLGARSGESIHACMTDTFASERVRGPVSKHMSHADTRARIHVYV
jgi:hypothetical protein